MFLNQNNYLITPQESKLLKRKYSYQELCKNMVLKRKSSQSTDFESYTKSKTDEILEMLEQ